MSRYLDKTDKEEMLKYQQLISDYMTVTDALKERLQRWFVSKFQKYGLEPDKMWTLDTQNGQIKLKEEEPKNDTPTDNPTIKR